MALSFFDGGISPAGLQWTLVYPPTEVLMIAATTGPAGMAAAKTLTCASAPGLFTCVLMGQNVNAISSGVVANIQLTPAANVATPSIGVSNTLGVDPSGFGLTVSAGGLAQPVLQVSGPADLGGITLGQSVSGTFTASGGVPPYVFAVSGLPAGVKLTGDSITGTPKKPGAYSVGVTVTDSLHSTASKTIGLSVFGISTPSLPGAVISSAYSYSITATGGQPPYSFSGSSLPPNFVLTPGGALMGTGTVPGRYLISVTVRDARGLSSSTSFPFAVTAPIAIPRRPAFVTSVGTPYSQELSAWGGTPPYLWSSAGGSLPAGTSLKPTGTLVGTPDRPGSYTFTARVTDQTGASATRTFSATVEAQPVTITTPAMLASGMVTVDYPVQVISASGGTAPWVFTASPDTLPPGLGLSPNGAIVGTPTVAGSFSFSITAIDSNGQAGTEPFQITVRPFSTDLITSVGSLSFSLAAGAIALPAAQAVRVQSTDVTQALAWSTAIEDAPVWLSVSSGGTAPGSFTVALTAAALSLTASATPYRATIAVSCMAPAPCAGSSQKVAVSLQVRAAPPHWKVLTNLLSFTASSSKPQTTTQSVVIENLGVEGVGDASFTCPASWCRINSLPVTTGSVQIIDITADPAGLTPGYYYTDLTIDGSGTSTIVPVTLFITATPSLELNPSGVRMDMPSGGVGAVPDSSFLVSASGTAPVAWNATVLPGAPWLKLSNPRGSSTDTAPGTVGYFIDQTISAALPPQVYYGSIRVASVGTADSPRDFQVVLNVTASSDTVVLKALPAGLSFSIPASGSALPQTVQLFASSVVAVPYRASAATADGQTWLSVIPATGTISAASSAQSNISVSAAGLPPGVYRGSVSYSIPTASVPTANVTLVVKASAACIPTQIVPTQTGLVSNFEVSALLPTPLGIDLIDDCGSPVTHGRIVVTFSNADPVLELEPGNSLSARYSGTWMPRGASSQVSVVATAMAPGFVAASTRIVGVIRPGNAPSLDPGGTLNVFNPQLGAPLAPGSIVQIYGSSLATQTLSAEALPLPTSLGGTSVIVGGLQAPLFFVSPGRVNAQIPFELAPGQTYQVIVSNNGAPSSPDTIQVVNATPGIATLPSGYANAQHASDGSAVSEDSPVRPGEYAVIYVAGMGPTDVPVASGAGAPSNPLAQTANPPTITLGSVPAPFLFSGLTPGLVGSYQVVLQVPADAPDGDLPLVVTQAGFSGAQVILPVRR